MRPVESRSAVVWNAAVLFVMHEWDAPPAMLGEWAGLRGVAADVLRADEDALPDPSRYDAVVVLTAATGVLDIHLPWLRRERAWLAAALDRTAVLGVGFGAQVLAAALGGRVHRAPRPETGWIDVATSAPAVVPPGPWLTWQRDLVVPPPRARVLARNARGVQAFAAGPHLGVQFAPHAAGEHARWWRCRDPAHDPVAAIAPDPGPEPVDLQARAFTLFDAFASRAADGRRSVGRR